MTTTPLQMEISEQNDDNTQAIAMDDITDRLRQVVGEVYKEGKSFEEAVNRVYQLFPGSVNKKIFGRLTGSIWNVKIGEMLVSNEKNGIDNSNLRLKQVTMINGEWIENGCQACDTPPLVEISEQNDDKTQNISSDDKSISYRHFLDRIYKEGESFEETVNRLCQMIPGFLTDEIFESRIGIIWNMKICEMKLSDKKNGIDNSNSRTKRVIMIKGEWTSIR